LKFGISLTHNKTSNRKRGDLGADDALIPRSQISEMQNAPLTFDFTKHVAYPRHDVFFIGRANDNGRHDEPFA